MTELITIATDHNANYTRVPIASLNTFTNRFTNYSNIPTEKVLITLHFNMVFANVAFHVASINWPV